MKPVILPLKEDRVWMSQALSIKFAAAGQASIIKLGKEESAEWLVNTGRDAKTLSGSWSVSPELRSWEDLEMLFYLTLYPSY